MESDGATTPRAGEPAAVGSPRGSVSDSSGGSDPETYEDWITNIRLIEKLRAYVKERLESKAYEEAHEDSRIDPMIVDSVQERETGDQAMKVEKVAYPSLPRVG